MKTEFPTLDYYFVFAFTYCHLRAYERDKVFIDSVLEAHDVEMLGEDASPTWTEIDSRIIANLIKDAIPKMVAKAGLSGPIATHVLREAGIR